VIRDHEEIVPITQLAEKHYERHGKPFRIAVDEADWRFNNVTQAFVYTIRNGGYYYGSFAVR
jgi:Holliday junction resolvase YEN1